MRLRAEAITAYLGENFALEKFAVMDDSSTYFIKVKARDSKTPKVLIKELSRRCEVVDIGQALFCWIRADYDWTGPIVNGYLAKQEQSPQEVTGDALTT